ncbi:hypothetical protein MKEN_01385700 [Mycena kentingensis (nom. inval.)]|nr:hypothetical protein MKEN_01385700 [Mycena kentingensis (nom. inval.)]
MPNITRTIGVRSRHSVCSALNPASSRHSPLSYDATVTAKLRRGRDVFLAHWFRSRLGMGTPPDELWATARQAGLSWQKLKPEDKETYERIARAVRTTASEPTDDSLSSGLPTSIAGEQPTLSTAATGRVKRPPTAFTAFMAQARKDTEFWSKLVGDEHSARKQCQIAAKYWKTMPAELRQPYEQSAALNMHIFVQTAGSTNSPEGRAFTQFGSTNMRVLAGAPVDTASAVGAGPSLHEIPYPGTAHDGKSSVNWSPGDTSRVGACRERVFTFIAYDPSESGKQTRVIE